MGFNEWSISQAKTQIHAFDRTKVKPIGIVVLPVNAADRIQMDTFIIIDTPLAVNVIMGHKWIREIRGVVSTLHQVLRCQSPNGVYTIDIKGDPTYPESEVLNVNAIGNIKKLSKIQIKKTEKGNAKIDEELSKDEAK